jgi:hypothetical protein
MSEHDGHASNGEHDDHSLVGGKIAVLLISGVVTLGASLTPWIATSFLASRKALDFIRVAAAFSAGLIVSTLLIHMLPEATEFFVEYFELAYPEAVAELASEGGHGHGEDNIQRVIAYVSRVEFVRLSLRSQVQVEPYFYQNIHFLVSRSLGRISSAVASCCFCLRSTSSFPSISFMASNLLSAPRRQQAPEMSLQ